MQSLVYKNTRGAVAISSLLLEKIQNEFALNVGGIHGLSHWERVRENGLRLAEKLGADSVVAEYFAYLHDSQRLNDGWDPEHGRRAAQFVADLPQSLLPISTERLKTLQYACTYHSDGLITAGLNVQVCWDSDRLDLGRIGIQPDPQRLCTIAAKDPNLISWAWERSQRSG